MSQQATGGQYGTSKAISSELADATRQEILDFIRTSHIDLPAAASKDPWHYCDPTGKTDEAVKEFVTNGDKKLLANLAGIAAEKVPGLFHKAFPVVFLDATATPHIHLPGGRPNYIWSFIALGPLTVETGLPVLGSTRVELELESGEALHIKGSVGMWFTGKGGGTALLADWKIY
ncbi:MAG: hypothetical protein M1840_003243 [Geoglossum simile]|nr:MAG: hypothetical protein M1840_003243 [Geoglossum simile]